MRYSGWNAWQVFSPQPYAFYDIGIVWKDGQPSHESGASAGFGLRFATPWHQAGNIGLAWPLTRNITAPISGGGKRDPRIIFQITQEFK